jgi:four helix bundle protein
MEGASVKENVLKTKSYDFALRIVKACRYISTEQKEYVLSKQLLRCGTSIGANVVEANQAQSRADFISKLSIALKEAVETEYWLKLMRDSDILTHTQAASLIEDCLELKKILISALKTTKSTNT